MSGNQQGRSKHFFVPGDMSSAAALIGTAIAAGGRLRLQGINTKLPQPDAAIVRIARRFGARIRQDANENLIVEARTFSNSRKKNTLRFDLKPSPDLVPVVSGISAATGVDVLMTGIGHLRFKESDRISTLSREMLKLVSESKEDNASLTIGGSSPPTRKGEPIFLDSENDHRILMALTIAGISGRFGELMISDPDGLRKSYPTFVSDVQSLCQDKSILNIMSLQNGKKIVKEGPWKAN